ncbi:GAF domain-containing protein [Desulfoluna spongiiphila]|uniref:GAF domain-containing protein n=1 Tax=Desulfoluna spongiiphila TaxID=419481 RepID=A0A1G5GGP7_9BACT|nr:GAF domain-containing protein [Desulfoluna spongiiphila]SCY50752.1 GAF domain-containing protein [Desulfoluna spongiiphila]VVS93564.1 gaf domain [Desulfoluna spongiiphila]
MTFEPERKIGLPQFRAISHAISRYEDVTMLGHHLVESICISFEIKAASILLFDDREKQLFNVCSHGLSEEYNRVVPEFSDMFREFTQGRWVYFEDFANDSRVTNREAVKKEGIVSMLSVPIKRSDNILGLLKLYNSEHWILHDDDIMSVAVLAEQYGLVIENNGLQNFLNEVKVAMGSLPLRKLKGL